MPRLSFMASHMPDYLGGVLLRMTHYESQPGIGHDDAQAFGSQLRDGAKAEALCYTLESPFVCHRSPCASVCQVEAHERGFGRRPRSQRLALSKSCSASKSEVEEVLSHEPPRGCIVSRRKQLCEVLFAVAGAGSVFVPDAAALRAVRTPGGETLQALELDVGLRIVALSGSVPAQWEQDFKMALRGKAKISLERRKQLVDIFDELSQPLKKKSAATADAVTLSDVYLGPAIDRGLVQPVSDVEQQAWWELLPPRWQRLVRRNISGQISRKGDIWAVPYQWGCSLIAFRTDKLNERQGARPIADWSDLLQPALRGRLSFTDAPREFMGAVFKTLNLPLNATKADLAARGISKEKLGEQVARLRAQIRQVSSREQGQALAAGDVWAAVGPSASLLPLALQHNNIALAAPASGTILSADLWSIPRAAKGGNGQRGPSPLLPAWMLFGLEPARAAGRKGLQGGASPRLLPAARKPAAVGGSGGQKEGSQKATRLGNAGSLDLSLGTLMPDQRTLELSEFLEPLEPDMRELISDLLLRY